jgi:hypothetical protein
MLRRRGSISALPILFWIGQMASEQWCHRENGSYREEFRKAAGLGPALVIAIPTISSSGSFSMSKSTCGLVATNACSMVAYVFEIFLRVFSWQARSPGSFLPACCSLTTDGEHLLSAGGDPERRAAIL